MAKFADDHPLSFTLREMRRLSRSGRFWIVLLGVVVILGLTGPFNSFETLRFGARMAYWALVVIGSFAVGTFVSMLTTVSGERAGLAPPLALLLGGLLAAVPIAFYNALIQMGFFGGGFVAELGDVAVYALAISVIVAFVYRYGQGAETDTQVAADASSPPPSELLDRLPAHIGRDLVSVQAQDHYVKATTTAGSALVLMKMSHAERDLAGLEGVRVHRSWWVRKRHVKRLRRTNGKLVIETSQRASVPVGRKYRKSVLALFETA